MVTICTRLRQAADGPRHRRGARRRVLGRRQPPAARRTRSRWRRVDALVALAAHPKFVGIGETGLDYHYTAESAAAAGRRACASTSRPRARTGLPLIIHARDADADIGPHPRRGARRRRLRLRDALLHRRPRRWPRPRSASASTSRSPASRPSAAPADLRAIFADAPRDRLLVETDSPYLAPLPHRGKRNEPAYVADTARADGRAPRRSTRPTFAALTSANFDRLFPKAAAWSPA